jgi:TP901 family phage tail tape measure protein
MGRTDYIVTAGVGFDLDRSSAKNTVSAFEALASTLNTISTKKAAEGFQKNQKEYDKSLKGVTAANKKADKDLIAGTAKAAKATQEAIQKGRPKPLTKAQRTKMDPKEVKAYNKAFDTSMKGMSKSYAKFAKEAEKMGIKVRKSKGGFGAGQSTANFAKKDAETRKRLVNLTERMHKAEKERLKLIPKGTKGYAAQLAEVVALEKQHRDMKNLNEDIIQQEIKTAKIKSKNYKKEREAERKKREADKKIIMRQKAINNGLQRMGKLASMSAGKISSGLKNAFVIGTAAAAAFFYKMQPLAETVTEFEKTIINANSVFNVTRQELHSVSDEMVRFTLKYGVASQEMAQGLYQLASAGLSAAESQEVLQHTMKLAMATQGDHNALAKLTVQVIMGFGMEMSDSAELVDKFAHAIQRSLIEWEDLASSVKFAMPFFVATGQSIDELLGGLEVLTNRALEAGIAGRGLRQALAQFAKHADDNASAMRRLGIEIMDTEGNMRALHEIALDASAAFGDVTDLEALVIMLEDMNVRGATAFALLVQNADEFDAAVKNISHSAGEATLMAEIQQESLAMQIQRVKNALLAPFLLSDKIGEAEGSLNEFTLRIKELVDEFTAFFIVIGPDGVETITKHGEALKKFVIAVLNEAVLMVRRLKEVFLEQDEGFEVFIDLLHLATLPMKYMLDILDFLGPSALKWFVAFKLITALFPITNLLMLASNIIAAVQMAIIAKTNLLRVQETSNTVRQISALSVLMGTEVYGIYVKEGMWAATAKFVAIQKAEIAGTWLATAGWVAYYIAATAGLVVVGAFALKILDMFSPLKALAIILFGVAAAFIAMYSSMSFGLLGGVIVAGIAMALASLAAQAAGWGVNTGAVRKASSLPAMGFNKERSYDLGGVYLGTAEGGMLSTEHGMAQLQKGETVTSKTANMLGGGGMTLNFGDIYAEDGTDFADKVAAALPDALRRANDQGAI